MSSIFALRALLSAGELFIAAFLVMALALEAASFSKRPSMRHLIWTGAFGMLLVLPALALLLPSQIRLALLAATPAAAAMPSAQTLSASAVPAQASGFHVDIATAAYALATVWLAGIGFVALRGVIAAFGVRRLRRNSAPHALENITLPKIGPRYEVRVATAPNGCGPVTWGFLRPVILLPWASVFWPHARLQTVLLHELAHIRRRDSLTQILSLVACALYWPNPLVWIGARLMRNEAEIAADDAVLVSGVRPSSYAGELLQLATEFRGRAPALAGSSLFMAAPSALEARVASVLAPTQSRSGVTAMDILKITAVGLVAAATLAMARPSLAQDAPPVPPAPPVAVTPLSDVSTPPVPPSASTAPTPPAALPPLVPVAAVAPPLPVERIAPLPSNADIRIREERHTVNGRDVRRVRMGIATDGHAYRPATAQERAQIERRMAEANAQAARAGEEAARAGEEAARAGEEAARAAQPQIEAAVQDAMIRVQPEIDRAMAQARAKFANAKFDVKVRERVNAAMKRVEVRIVTRPGYGDEHEHTVVIEHSQTPDDN